VFWHSISGLSAFCFGLEKHFIWPTWFFWIPPEEEPCFINQSEPYP
jgi:hypothetical protein